MLEALRRTHREDLIGYGRECLLRPNRPAAGSRPQSGGARPAGKPQDQKLKQRGKRVEHNDVQPKRKAGWAKPKARKNAKPGKGRR